MCKSGHRAKRNRTAFKNSRWISVPPKGFVGQNTGNTQDVDKPVGNCLGVLPPLATSSLAEGSP